MAKKIKNPIDCRARIYFNEGERTYKIMSVIVAYGITCEHELEERREVPLDQNAEVLNIVKDFLEEAMKQLDVHEEIPEGDSLLNYNGAPDNYTNGASE